MLLPAGNVRVWSFIIFCIFLSIPQGCVNLCVVQLLLKTLPEQGREIMMSLYSLLLLLCNCLMPFIGVRIYQLFGSNLRAFILFLMIEFLLRIFSLVIIKLKLKEKI
jgi:hypothetical protein